MVQKESGNTYIASENARVMDVVESAAGNIKHSRSRDPYCSSLSLIVRRAPALTDITPLAGQNRESYTDHKTRY
ncbi:hypothetical protein BDZ97DRAFT_1835477 [Flammula alnicola]|nr:hypothetical protein BDZ97DRAFT_1835477 [Flammula alnicola]